MHEFESVKTNRGFANIISIVIIGLLFLSYFGISLKGIVDSPTGQSNFGYVKEITVNIWNNYLARPVLYFYNDIFIPLIWDPFVQGLTDLRDGKDILKLNAPTITTDPE